MPKQKLTLNERQSRTFDAIVDKYAALMGLDTDKDVADLMGIPHSTYAKRKKTKCGWKFWDLCRLFEKLHIPPDEIGNIFHGAMK